MDGDSIARLLYLSILFIAIAGWFAASNRPSLGKTLQMLLVWGMIFMGLMAGYGLWNDIKGGFNTGQQSVAQDGAIEVPLRRDGHFYLTLQVNGEPVEFLVDTGASQVVLTKADAATVGIDVGSLAFFGRAQTANGEVRTARVMLDHVVLEDLEDRRVLASVNDGELDISLLGMSYLSRFDRIEITPDALLLYR